MTLYIILCILLAAVFGGSYWAYRTAFYSPMKGRDIIPEITDPHYAPYQESFRTLIHALKEKPCETVTISSADGLTLSGRYYHTADDAPLAICFHGYKSRALTDFCGGAGLSFRLGHNLLLVDQRAHGKSQGRTITFGIKERQDLLCWVNYALERFGPDVRILLYGISMGGATVVMASGESLPKNVRGIIADCPYTSAMDIILEVGRQQNYPLFLVRPFAILGAKIFGGFDLRETSAPEAVKRSQVPILLLHGQDDTFVPPAMSRAIHQANPKMTRLHIFPGAYHALSYMVDTPRYESLVTDFIRSVL